MTNTQKRVAPVPNGSLAEAGINAAVNAQDLFAGVAVLQDAAIKADETGGLRQSLDGIGGRNFVGKADELQAKINTHRQRPLITGNNFFDRPQQTNNIKFRRPGEAPKTGHGRGVVSPADIIASSQILATGRLKPISIKQSGVGAGLKRNVMKTEIYDTPKEIIGSGKADAGLTPKPAAPAPRPRLMMPGFSMDGGPTN